MSDKPVSWEERYAKWDKFEEGVRDWTAGGARMRD